LAHNSALKTLLLDANQVGNFGAQQMVAPLTTNTSLLVLGLTNNGLSTAVGDKVRAAVGAGRRPRDISRLEILF
jgi:hypothetical protein